MKLFFSLLLVLLPGISALGQSYTSLVEHHKDGQFIQLQHDAWLVQHPQSDPQISGKLKKGTEVFVYKQVNDFYAVATPQNGHAGYVLAQSLGLPVMDPSSVDLMPANPQKSVLHARLLSIALPGAGHIYAEEYEEGVALALISLTSLIGGQLISENTAEFVCVSSVTPDTCSIETDYSMARLGAALYIGFVAISAWRSGAAIRRHRANNLNAPQFKPVIGTNQVGMSLTLPLN